GMARSLRINPNSATALIHAGWLMIYTARPTEAIPLFERVRRLSPLHPQIGVATCGIGAAQLTLGNDDAALEALEQALAEYPEFATTRIQLIAVQSRLGNIAEAQRHADWLKRKVPHHTVSMQLEINQNRSPDWEGPMIAGLRATGFPE
ncbi:MAG: tetratricopeptide repeat protein, partial [Pseudomonadota bacterium]